MPRIEELLALRELVDYTQTRQFPPLMGEVLFPEQKIDALEIEMLKGANNLPVAASVHSFDTETEIASREGINAAIQDLALIKRKQKISEKELIVLNAPRSNSEERQVIARIFNDVDGLVNGVRARVEALRMEALGTGKIVLNENGVKGTIDFGVPGGQKTSKTWLSATPRILEDITDMVNAVVTGSGFRPTRVLTSQKILNGILKDDRIRKAMYGVNADKVANLNDLNQLLVSQGLPKIATYDGMFRVQGENGKYTTKRYFKEDAFVLMPEGKLGDTFYGLTAEEVRLRNTPGVDIEMFGNILTQHYTTNDPVAEWIKAVATAMPSFPAANQIYIATIS
ncbi:major capsid protein [Niameybacter massiliensis]|uniref:major capsid protein n=1 Tax=Niameybacter massiliensis TaxID=1658108 RepID=UPI0006B5C145|nr:major capsid protein [Niameybacter massiliensis]